MGADRTLLSSPSRELFPGRDPRLFRASDACGSALGRPDRSACRNVSLAATGSVFSSCCSDFCRSSHATGSQHGTCAAILFASPGASDNLARGTGTAVDVFGRGGPASITIPFTSVAFGRPPSHDPGNQPGRFPPVGRQPAGIFVDAPRQTALRPHGTSFFKRGRIFLSFRVVS